MSPRRTSKIDLETRPDGSVVITHVARNLFVAVWVSAFAGLPALASLLLAIKGLVRGDFALTLMFLAACAGFIWLSWRFGWRPRRFQIFFDADGIRSGPNRLAYSEITEIIVGYHGGAAYDPASMPVPRNVTPGYHVAAKAGGQVLPITTSLVSRTDAVALQDLCIEVWKRFTTPPPHA